MRPFLNDLAALHGLSNVRGAGDCHLIADIGSGQTYTDVARFELAAQGLLGGTVDVILSRTEGAEQADRGVLGANRAAPT